MTIAKLEEQQKAILATAKEQMSTIDTTKKFLTAAETKIENVRALLKIANDNMTNMRERSRIVSLQAYAESKRMSDHYSARLAEVINESGTLNAQIAYLVASIKDAHKRINDLEEQKKLYGRVYAFPAVDGGRPPSAG